MIDKEIGYIKLDRFAQQSNDELVNALNELKKEGMWFVCADMGGTSMYQLDLKGPMGLVIGNEGDGVSRLVREKCDFITFWPSGTFRRQCPCTCSGPC